MFREVIIVSVSENNHMTCRNLAGGDCGGRFHIEANWWWEVITILKTKDI